MTNPNIPSNTPDQSSTPEKLQAVILSNDLKEIVRTVYSHADNDVQREALFSPDGFDGTNDLLAVADDVLSEGRALDSNEEPFVSYMVEQSKNHVALSLIDTTVLEQPIDTSNGTELTGDDAVNANLSNTIGTIKQKSKSTKSPDERARLENQADNLETFRIIYENSAEINPGGTNEDGIKPGHVYMEAVRVLRAANTDDERAAAQSAVDGLAAKMKLRADQFQIQADAYEAVYEHGRPSFRNTDVTNRTVTFDPRLGVVNPAAAPAGTPPAGGTPPPQNGGNPPAGGNGGGNQPPANGGNQPPAGGGNGGNNPPTPNALAAQLTDVMLKVRMDEMRSEMAETKSRFMRNSKIGRGVLGVMAGTGIQNIYGFVTGGKRILTQQDMDDRLDYYNFLARESVTRKYESVLSDPNVDDSVKRFAVAKGLIDEQTELRKETNEEMQNKQAVKIGRWMGKHKILTVAGLTVLAPLTGFASSVAGMSLGIGMIAGAKTDAKFRGLREVKKSLTHEEMIVAAGANNDFIEMQKYAMRNLDSEMSREVWKRAGAVGVMAAIAIGGTNFLSNPHDVDRWIYGHQTFMRWAAVAAGGIDLSIPRQDKKAGAH
ncbi:MAG: hypothetical protein JWN75_916 [Candidatus Saccharibacteria bacterium]|nr:hypothetical protein [Candidatus Saccharibacteria bacterium]